MTKDIKAVCFAVRNFEPHHAFTIPICRGRNHRYTRGNTAVDKHTNPSTAPSGTRVNFRTIATEPFITRYRNLIIGLKPSLLQEDEVYQTNSIRLRNHEFLELKSLTVDSPI